MSIFAISFRIKPLLFKDLYLIISLCLRAFARDIHEWIWLVIGNWELGFEIKNDALLYII